LHDIGKINFAGQNCQSLNVSKKSDKTLKKILALVKNREDVIFLSDIKLNSGENTHAAHDIEKKFFNVGYKFLHNSSKSSRGVGILIKNELKWIVMDEKKDENCNYLLTKINTGAAFWVFGAVYGPNGNDMDFFTDLERDLKTINCEKIVLGGDWNATWDPRPPGRKP
jgi:exonuclease III